MAKRKARYPIEHWSYSSLTSFLRNPLAWQKRYIENVRDMPSGPASFIGRAGHKALEYYYSGIGKEESIKFGLDYLRNVADFEIDFGKATTKVAKKKKREAMEREYLQSINFYLKRAPRHNVLGVEVVGLAKVRGLPLPLKAISDLVVESPIEKGAVDIIDHKFVSFFSEEGTDKPLFIIQAMFNYYTVMSEFDMPVRRFILQECKRGKNKNGASQMKKHIIDFKELDEDFELFHRLIKDVTKDMASRKIYLPNPSDMFEGKNSFDIYRLGL